MLAAAAPIPPAPAPLGVMVLLSASMALAAAAAASAVRGDVGARPMAEAAAPGSSYSGLYCGKPSMSKNTSAKSRAEAGAAAEAEAEAEAEAAARPDAPGPTAGPSSGEGAEGEPAPREGRVSRWSPVGLIWGDGGARGEEVRSRGGERKETEYRNSRSRQWKEGEAHLVE